jgi:hypothetical protein
MRTKGANDMKSAATATRSMKIMISPLVSKVKLISCCDFAGYRDCFKVLLLVERFPARRGIGNACGCKGIRGKGTRKPKQRPTATERSNDDEADGICPF